MGFDTVNHWLPIERAGTKNLLSHCSNFLENKTTSESEKGNYVSGHLGNLKIFVNSYGIKFTGSLSKWYLGDNIQDITRGDTKRAIEKLSDYTQLPIKDSVIKRVDFGEGLIMNEIPNAYYPLLGQLRHFTRLEQKTTINYLNPNKELIFYNKIVESKNKRVEIPTFLKNSNLLRYEMKFCNDLPNQMNMSEVLMSNLYEETFYMKIIDNWEQHFKQIFKIRKSSFKSKEMIKPNDIIDELTLIGIQTLGYDSVLNMVEEAKRKGLFEYPKYVTRAKTMVKDLMSKESLTEPNELMLELERKINRARANYR
jgi:hypothetical protein